MRRFAILPVVLLAGFSFAADEKGTPVKFGELASTTPTTWVKEEPPASSFIKRYAQFRLPKQGDDKSDAYVVVFAGLGGGAKANIDRWRMQMGGGEGKVTEIKIAGQDATRLEIEGTYSGTSLDGKSKPTPLPKAMGVFYQFDGADQVYHIRLVGPAKTVEHYKKGYDAWVQGFKK